MAIPKREDRGKIIRRKREAAALTLSYISGRIGISQKHLSRLEHSEGDASAETLAKIASILRLTQAERDELYLAFGKLPPEIQNWVDHNPQKLIRMIRMIMINRKKQKGSL